MTNKQLKAIRRKKDIRRKHNVRTNNVPSICATSRRRSTATCTNQSAPAGTSSGGNKQAKRLEVSRCLTRF